MKLLVVDGNPHLALFSTRKICKDEEICYDYGEKNLEWRIKVNLTNPTCTVAITIFLIT
jgi:SET domain-containing protein